VSVEKVSVFYQFLIRMVDVCDFNNITMSLCISTYYVDE
jgi:hypothetical protein